MSAIKCRFCNEMLTGLQPGDHVVSVAAAANPPTPRARERSQRNKTSSLRTLVGLGVLAGIVFVIYMVNTGSSFHTAISGPEVIRDETVILDEGEGRAYGFSISSDRRIRLEVHAHPQRVNVWLMTESDYAEFKQARAKFFGGRYHYRRDLSTQGVTDAEPEALLQAGQYFIVVERPEESILVTDKTSAHVVIKGM